jgi:hypothetical protein
MAMISRLPILTGLCLALLASCGRQTTDGGKADSASPQAADALPEKVTFNAHIRPIFSDTCFACHGFDAKTRKEDLRLDTSEGAYAKLKDSDQHAIVPGKPNESAILAHIFSNDPDEIMPPLDFHKTLTAHQKALVRRWIEQGAEYQQHWSFIPITKSPPPSSTALDRRINCLPNTPASAMPSSNAAPAMPTRWSPKHYLRTKSPPSASCRAATG